MQTTGVNGISGQTNTSSTPPMACKIIVIMPTIRSKKRTTAPIRRDKSLSKNTESHILEVEASPTEICRKGANKLPTSKRMEKKSAAFLRRLDNLEEVIFHPRVYHH